MPLALSESYLFDEGMAYSRLRARVSPSATASVGVKARKSVSATNTITPFSG